MTKDDLQFFINVFNIAIQFGSAFILLWTALIYRRMKEDAAKKSISDATQVVFQEWWKGLDEERFYFSGVPYELIV
ncbi:MAG: hypothetical protein HY268_20675 [Deltaproteobacteria bacterium]|nr:hypothetical protein [Deltaproteobacteria bacterium]